MSGGGKLVGGGIGGTIVLVLALLFGDDDVGSILNNVTGTGTTSSSVSNTL